MNTPIRRIRRILGLCALSVATSSGGAAAAAAAAESYRGMCDASAAVALGAGHFVVADDEGDVLRIYQRGTPMPVASVDLVDFLGNRKPNGNPTEADIEGAATIGQRIYWISSHARKGKDGEVDPHRRRFFATDILPAAPSPSLQPVGKPYAALLDDLLADARFALLADAATRKPEAAGGLNIEGLAAMADGSLLIGFRNPQPQGRALLVPLRNPREVVEGAAKPRFGDPIQLDLGGRGIRSLERVGNDLLIAAGPFSTADSSTVQPAFALFRWSGQPAQAAVFVRSLDAGSFRPEAMFVDAQGPELVLLSDDGDEPVDGKDCKHKSVPIGSKGFRMRTLPLPLPLTPAKAACNIDQSERFAGEKLLLARREGLPKAARLGLFKAPLAVNTDGAPTSYHPDDYTGDSLALNHLDNAIVIQAKSGAKLTLAQRMAVFDRWYRSGNWQVPKGYKISWQNVIAVDAGQPCVFKQDHAGYFGSLTALRNGLGGAAAGECGVHDQLDQRYLPSLVLRGSANPLRGWGAAVGDLALVTHPATGVNVAAIIGDSGDGKRIGEGSVALNLALLSGATMPANYRQARSLDTGTQDMVVAVLLGSRHFERTRPYTRENIAQRVQDWAAAQGYGSVQALADAALQCSAGL